MSDTKQPKLELQISSPQALVRRMDQQLELVERLLAEAEHALVPANFTNSLGMKMIWCPAGDFLMGTPATEERHIEDENQVLVRISQGFWIATTPVTQIQWQTLMGNNPSHFSGSHNLPVEMVSWDDAAEFCAKLNTMESLPRCYHYSLPTEAQWEYACRAGTTTPFYFGRDITNADARFDARFREFERYGKEVKAPIVLQTSVVGSYPPNAWGLYDMHGNIWEWCTDWFEDTRISKNYLLGGIDPTGPSTGLSRGKRGGAWSGPASNCRSARRFADPPGCRVNDAGFRVALVPFR